MRSPFIGLGGAIAAIALVASSLLVVAPAHAQRALTNTDLGGDPPPASRQTDSLVECSNRNTARLGLGRSDACLGLLPNAESVGSVSTLVSNYNASPGLLYTLALSAAAPDRQTVGSGAATSSGGLFEATGLGTSSLGIKYLREEVGSFVFAFSGVYANSGTGGLLREWSGYYLFDNVITNIILDGTGANVGVMNYRPFEEETFIDIVGGTPTVKPRWVFTNGIEVNQVSVYRLNRVIAQGVPEPAGIALVLLALGAAGLARRRRRTH